MVSMILFAGITAFLGLTMGLFVISVMPKFWIKKAK